MKKILKDSFIQKLKKAFLRKKEVLAVYIFGSRATGLANSSSDLDMAVFVSDRQKNSEREMIKFLTKRTGNISFNLDLSLVDFSSPPLFFLSDYQKRHLYLRKNPSPESQS